MNKYLGAASLVTAGILLGIVATVTTRTGWSGGESTPHPVTHQPSVGKKPQSSPSASGVPEVGKAGRGQNSPSPVLSSSRQGSPLSLNPGRLAPPGTARVPATAQSAAEPSRQSPQFGAQPSSILSVTAPAGPSASSGSSRSSASSGSTSGGGSVVAAASSPGDAPGGTEANSVEDIPVPAGAIVPASFYDGQNRTPQQQAALEQIAAEFDENIANPAPDVSEAENWETAREIADRRYLTLFGYQAYNERHLQAAKEAVKEKKALSTVSSPAQ